MQVSIIYGIGVVVILSNVLLLDATAVIQQKQQLRGDTTNNDEDVMSYISNNEEHHSHPEPRTLQVGGVGKVVSWRLINATAGNKGQTLIDPLLNDAVIDLSKYPGNQKFSIEAVTSNINGPIGSVRFQYENNVNYRTENEAPYSLCGDSLGQGFKPCPNLVIVGTTTVAATPYSLIKGTGINGMQSKISFRIVKSPAIPLPVPTKPPSFVPTKLPSKVPKAAPFTAPTTAPIQNNYLSAQWIEVQPNAPIDARHEACFIMVGRRAYLLAGRAIKAVNIYDPITRSWTNGAAPPIQIHHTQCVAVNNDSIWIVSPWTGGYPKERNTDMIYVCQDNDDTFEIVFDTTNF